ncbi:ubiquitin carboxyl-terminal hydrolase 2-like [Phragmites australis]|uniref:ubiquitin carboxyl-terminal hydrolase 2-like n=1 Tax=Phragmites australis TaxID=29695 RepID=UPI002D78E2A8|nr:ubiquitin carboxyl-terminal hydrolase 2-like [Phragmites australis]
MILKRSYQACWAANGPKSGTVKAIKKDSNNLSAHRLSTVPNPPRTPFAPLARALPRPNRDAMGKKEEKGARLAVMDSGRGDSPSPEVVTSSEECEHFCYDTEEMGTLLAKIRSLKHDPACDDCWNKAAGRRARAAGGGKKDPLKQKLEKSNAHIMMCSECSRCFCSDVRTKEDEPGGHARRHAHQADHQVAMWIDQPNAAYCFECGCSLCLQAIVEAVDDEAGGRASGSADGLGYVVRGMTNLRNTCYANALVQCLLVLDKLRMWMLGPDAPTGSIGMALKELFMQTRAGNDAGAMLNLEELLESVGALNSKYKGRDMEDSQEFLNYLRQGLNEEEKLKRPPNMPGGVPTVVDFIFGGQLSITYTCKYCPYNFASHTLFYELQPTLPAKEHPTKSVVSPQRGHRSRGKRPAVKRLFPAIEQCNSEKVQTIAGGGDSHIYGTKLEFVAMDKAPKPLEVDSTKAEQIRQSKNAVQVTTEDKEKALSSDIVYEKKVEDRNSLASIKDCLAFYFKEKVVDWRCGKCSNKVPEQPRTARSKDGGQMVASTDKNIKLGNSAHQVGENQNEKRYMSGHAIERTLISKLPPVLTVHLLRFDRDSNLKHFKKSGHVSFEENLDLGSFVDPRSEDKGNSTYSLVGVVEHVGTLDCGHYVAYVRASRIRSHQQLSSGSSSWFRASDLNIKEVSLEEVLKCEAFLLFYERMEG